MIDQPTTRWELVLLMLTTLPLKGVERISRRVWGGQLPHWDGGIPAGGVVWLHRIQVSHSKIVSAEQMAIKQ